MSVYRCQRCGERLGAHGSHAPGLFRCADGVDVPWAKFRDGAGVAAAACADLGCVNGMSVQGRAYDYDGKAEDQWAPCGHRLDTCPVAEMSPGARP